jgi:hypothetical protein
MTNVTCRWPCRVQIGSSLPICTRHGHRHRVTVTRGCNDTICLFWWWARFARNMWRVKNKYIEKNCASRWSFTKNKFLYFISRHVVIRIDITALIYGSASSELYFQNGQYLSVLDKILSLSRTRDVTIYSHVRTIGRMHNNRTVSASQNFHLKMETNSIYETWSIRNTVWWTKVINTAVLRVMYGR